MRCRPLVIAIDGSLGVEGSLKTSRRPFRSKTKSVKVPPVSTPIRRWGEAGMGRLGDAATRAILFEGRTCTRRVTESLTPSPFLDRGRSRPHLAEKHEAFHQNILPSRSLHPRSDNSASPLPPIFPLLRFSPSPLIRAPAKSRPSIPSHLKHARHLGPVASGSHLQKWRRRQLWFDLRATLPQFHKRRQQSRATSSQDAYPVQPDPDGPSPVSRSRSLQVSAEVLLSLPPSRLR